MASQLRGNRLLGIALATLLVASLAANVVLVRLWIADARKVHIARLDPAELNVHAAARANPPPAGHPILVLFGDSRAAMWPTPTALTEYTVLNRGVGNQTTAQIALRIDADVAPLHPAVVVLEAGVNDLKTIADIPERRSQIVADCEANLRLIVDRCRAIGATVILMSVFDIGDISIWRQPFWSDDVQAAVREVNAFLPTLTGDRVVLLPSAAVLDDEHGRIKPAYQLDFLHLVPAGYEALDEKLLSVVRGLPSRASAAP
jgi:lysophospholipase L1-like esterase